MSEMTPLRKHQTEHNIVLNGGFLGSERSRNSVIEHHLAAALGNADADIVGFQPPDMA